MAHRAGSGRPPSGSGSHANGGGKAGGAAAAAEASVSEADLYGACRPVGDFTKLGQIGEGAYGTVYRGLDKATGATVALKRVILHNEKQDGFPLTSLREVRMLKKIAHPNCVRLLEIAVGRKRDGVFLVFEYCEHDMAHLIDHMGKRFTQSEVKNLLLQLLRGVEHLHEHWIIHRDIKMSNLLYTNTGRLKLADFGLARLYGAPPKPMTPKVVTLWYRAPELLLGSETYDVAIDMWAVGCIFGEFLAYKPLLPGQEEAKQLEKIFELLGAPNERIWPGVLSLPHVASGAVALRPDRYPYNNLGARFPTLSEQGVDLLSSLLAYDPGKRLNATDAQRHKYLTRERPYPKESDMMPTFASRHDEMLEQERRQQQQQQQQQLLLAAQQAQRGGGGGTAMLLNQSFFSGGARILPVAKKPKR